MGNKFLILFVYSLFSIFTFSSLKAYAQSGNVIEEVIINGKNQQTLCLEQQGSWEPTSKKCVGALSCKNLKNVNCIDAAAVKAAEQSCKNNGGIYNTLTGICDNKKSECIAAGGKWVVDESKTVLGVGGMGAAMAFKCDYSKKANQASCDTSTSVADHKGEDGQQHCTCLYRDPSGQTGEYVAGTGNSCPKEDSSKNTSQKAGVTGEVYDCIANIQQKIQACADSVNEGQDSCDARSSQNQKYTGPASTLANTLSASMHAKGAASGAAQQCRNAAMLSTSSQYAVNAVAQSCNKAVQACKNSCEGVTDVYSDPSAIIASCEDPNVDQATLEAQAHQLASEVAQANKLCSGATGSLTKQLGNLTNYAGQLGNAFAQAAACDCALTNSCPTDCMKNPSSAACQSSYTDCAQNPSAPACKCVVNPYDSSCKTAVSQLAGASMGGNSNSGYTPTNVSGSTGGTADGGTGSFDLGEGPGPSNYIGGNSSGDASSLDFKRAGPVSAAGGGAIGGSGVGSGSEEGSGDEADSKGLAGVFKNITNGVKSMLGLGGAKSSSAEINKKANEKRLLEEKKKYRGIATADKFCVVGPNGQELCFGRKNMNIFQMINRGYSKQSDTFLDKK